MKFTATVAAFLSVYSAAAYGSCQTREEVTACVTVSPGQDDLAVKFTYAQTGDLFHFAQEAPHSNLYSYTMVDKNFIIDQRMEVDSLFSGDATSLVAMTDFVNQEEWNIDVIVHGYIPKASVAKKYAFVFNKNDLQ